MNYESLHVGKKSKERIEKASREMSEKYGTTIDEIRLMILTKIQIFPPLRQCQEAIERVRTELRRL